MSKTIFKAGQEVVANKDFDVEGFFDEEPIKVKKGSKAFISADGFLHHTTGAARGKIQKLSEEAFEVKGYDHENIAVMVLDRLKLYFPINEFIDDYDVSEKEMLDQIEDTLREIL